MALSEYLNQRRAAKPVLLMTHVVCGYPSFEDNLKELEIMATHGVDLVELQFPFSEPSADGPLFVKANQLSIANGTSVDQCFEFMARVNREFDFKTLMMGYYNTAFPGSQSCCANNRYICVLGNEFDILSAADSKTDCQRQIRCIAATLTAGSNYLHRCSDPVRDA